VIVFGGTFDPPHRAHIELPRAVRNVAGADALLYIPAAQSPLKRAAPGASADERLEMLRLALADDPRSLVTTIELDRGGAASFTIDTLRSLAAQFGPHVTMRLLIGADQAAEFHRWREPREIINLAEPLVMLRVPAESWDALRGRMAVHWTDAETGQWGRRVVSVPTLDVSATRIREMLSMGAPDADFEGLLPRPVLAYIRHRGLYGAR
jgi:nicotinate-nucleotide adenylyltransferase